ncbi:Pilus assembly protein PilO [Candidatus Electrothrix laxa]
MASESTKSKFDVFIEEKFIPLDQKIKIAVAVGVVAAILAGFYFVVFVPKQENIKKLESERASLQAEVDRAVEAEENLKKMKEELAEVEKRFEKISIVLPKTKEIPTLLTSISDHGTSAGLDFNSFTPGKESPKDFYAEIPISIAVRGPYHNVGYFLDQVSKLERIVTVKNIKMGSPKTVEGEMLLSSSCNLMTYRFLNEEERAQAQKKRKKK